MGGGKYKPQEYIEGPDPFKTKPEVTEHKDLSDYSNTPEEVIDAVTPTEKQSSQDVTPTYTSQLGAARGLKI